MRIFLSSYWWQESDIWSQASYRYAILWEAFLDPSDSYFRFADFVDFYTHWTYILYMPIFSRIFLSNYWWQETDIWSQASTKCMFNVYKNQQSRQTRSRNLMGPKTFPTIWGTYMKLVTKYQISAINSCWEKCDEKCAYTGMFNVYKNQLSRQTGSRNLMGPKTLPTIWHTYMKLATKYQIPVINSYLEWCDEKCAYTNASVRLSVLDIFRRIFHSNCWWQKSDIWSQALYSYTILRVAFLDPSDSYFLFADFVDFYTHWTYMLIFRRIFLSSIVT
jgi:hypothetical protein